MTEVEARELEEKNRQLKEHMKRFEEKTKKIQALLEKAQMGDAAAAQETPPSRKHKEDMLPKVIICGATENNMPKIIVCNDKKKSSKGQPAQGVKLLFFYIVCLNSSLILSGMCTRLCKKIKRQLLHARKIGCGEC